jgi:myosin heavy subunit
VSAKSDKEAAAGPKQSLEQQILAANPILEALGNAKTLRNNNSSRFGKLITVNFDKNGSIIGGNIINYLLEKSRVVQQTEGERNYHIFYQLISAANTNSNLQEELKLQDAELFAYTGQSGVIKVKGISDEKDFEEIQNSLNILQFTPDEKTAIFKIVSGVLHFGNVKFKVEQRANAEDSCSISNLDVLGTASSMWGIDVKNIEKYLTSRNVGSREVITVSYNISQALDARDAMVKKVYAELFQFVVDRINVALSSGGAKRNKFIGVLDIFGFESFVVRQIAYITLCILTDIFVIGELL